jgi:hypothetical protein
MKRTEGLSQERRVVTVFVGSICRLLGGNLDWPAEHQPSCVNPRRFHTTLGQQKRFPGCRNKGVSASAVFLWSAKNGIPRSSRIFLSPTSKHSLATFRLQYWILSNMSASSGPLDDAYITRLISCLYSSHRS